MGCRVPVPASPVVAAGRVVSQPVRPVDTNAPRMLEFVDVAPGLFEQERPEVRLAWVNYDCPLPGPVRSPIRAGEHRILEVSVKVSVRVRPQLRVVSVDVVRGGVLDIGAELGRVEVTQHVNATVGHPSAVLVDGHDGGRLAPAAEPLGVDVDRREVHADIRPVEPGVPVECEVHLLSGRLVEGPPYGE